MNNSQVKAGNGAKSQLPAVSSLPEPHGQCFFVNDDEKDENILNYRHSSMRLKLKQKSRQENRTK